MLKSFARIFHQLIALSFFALIILGALFALASMSNTTIADVFRVNNPTSQVETSPASGVASPEPKENPATLSLGLAANVSIDTLPAILQNLQSADIDAIILFGNITQTGSVDELRQVKVMLDNVRIPTYFIPGTNDLQSSVVSSIFGFRPNSQMYQEVDLAGFRLLLLDNADPTVGIAPEQWAWLAAALAETKKETPTFLFLHTRTQTTPAIEPQNGELERLFALASPAGGSASPSAVFDASMVDQVAILDVFEDNRWSLTNLEIRN
ncbi:MAG: hypothetical protein Q8R11_02920 [bacterium]|nr:hypothetical protein [bacterium]